MSALARKCERVEGGQMPLNEKDEQAVQIAELRSDVRHIQSDVSDIKAELRAWHPRIESLEKKMDARFERMDQKIDSLKDSLSSAKIWALGLYIALTGSLLFVMAHGFKWL
jgi:peptidoglycan hydrolase CwlO-like protein